MYSLETRQALTIQGCPCDSEDIRESGDIHGSVELFDKGQERNAKRIDAIGSGVFGAQINRNLTFETDIFAFSRTNEDVALFDFVNCVNLMGFLFHEGFFCTNVWPMG